MKNIWLLLVFVSCLLTSAILFAAGGAAEKEEYDEDTYGPKASIFWVKPVKTVVFEHKVHTMDAGLSCDSCHDELFEMEAGAAEAKDDFTMATLYQGGYCGSCHDGSTAFASNTRCTTCHIGVRGHARLTGETGTNEKSH